MVCTAASQPLSRPAANCKEPVASTMSAFSIVDIAFPTKNHGFSSIPTGLTPGHFLRAIN